MDTTVYITLLWTLLDITLTLLDTVLNLATPGSATQSTAAACLPSSTRPSTSPWRRKTPSRGSPTSGWPGGAGGEGAVGELWGIGAGGEKEEENKEQEIVAWSNLLSSRRKAEREPSFRHVSSVK